VPKINKMTENLKFSNENKIRVHFIHQSIWKFRGYLVLEWRTVDT
jgi:hypothetical protein